MKFVADEWTYRAQVVRVVDGDTLEIQIDLGFRVQKVTKIRLIGIDTPEVYGVKHESEEYQKGKLASEFTFIWVRQQRGEILIRSTKGTGKYGRWLAEVWSRDHALCLNDDLVAAGHAILMES